MLFHLPYLLPIQPLERAAVVAAGALVAGLWQGIALAVVVGLLLRLLPRTSATVRFAIWAAVFAASVAMPLLHLALLTRGTSASGAEHVMVDARWSYLLAGLWFGAAVYRLAVLATEAVGLRRLWREASPVDERVLEAAGLGETLAERGVKVCVTSEVDRPSVIGFFAPKILIPDWLLSQLPEVELRHIVLHELEHLRRRDDWMNLLQKIGLVVFPLNPAMFWIDRRLSTEREIACDDGVLEQTKTPRAYAASLASIAERRLTLSSHRRMVALALGAFGAGKLLSRRPELARRIESILGQRASGNPALAAVLIAGIVGGAAAMTRAPELVSFAAQDGVAGASQIALKESPDAGRAAVRRIVPAARMENVSLRIVQPVSKPALAEVGRAATEDAARDGVMVPGSLRVGSARFVATRATLDAPRPVAVAAVQKEMVDQEQEWVLIASWTASPIESQEVSAETLPAPTQTVVNGGDTRAIVATNTVLKDKGGKPGATNFARPVSQIVVRTPDGRFYVLPYAAVPTQAGWLIVQL